MEQAEQGFRKTGSRTQRHTLTPHTARPVEGLVTPQSRAFPAGANGSSMSMMEPREQVKALLSQAVQDKPFSELSQVTFDHRGAGAIGHVLLDTLEVQGFSVDDIDAVGALTAAAVPLVDAIIHAASSRGEVIDGFVMDFVYPSIKGPSIAGKRVVLIDAWLSEKSFVQTSSLVTLHHGNSLDLDCSVVAREQAQIMAIASLVGKPAGPQSTIKLTDTVSGESCELPFIYVFHEEELKAGPFEGTPLALGSN